MKNLNKKRLIIVMMINLIGFASYSQETESNTFSQSEFYQLQEELQGKFQIQMIGSRAHPAISQDLLIEIQSRQEQSERVFFDYKPKIRIMILSKEEVLGGIVVPEEESIIYINQ